LHHTQKAKSPKVVPFWEWSLCNNWLRHCCLIWKGCDWSCYSRTSSEVGWGFGTGFQVDFSAFICFSPPSYRQVCVRGDGPAVKIITIHEFWRYTQKGRHYNNKNSMVLAKKYMKTNHCYARMIFDKGAQNIWWRKWSLFNKCCWENWISTFRKLKLDHVLSPCTSINLMWIKNLSMRPETLKLV
jgi:hypothetical protein